MRISRIHHRIFSNSECHASQRMAAERPTDSWLSNDKGDTLTYSEYLGGAGNDFSNAIAASNNGNVVCPRVLPPAAPASDAFQPGFGGGVAMPS